MCPKYLFNLEFISCYSSFRPPIFSQFEEKFEEINAVEEQPSIPAVQGVEANNYACVPSPRPEIGGSETAIQGVEPQISSDASTSHDFVSGILKIVPEVDVSHYR